MESLAVAFANTLGRYVSKEIVVFIISMIPILELRGGLIVSKLLQVPITTAIPFCIVGNIIPIPFILLFIKQIFKLLKKVKFFRVIIERLENRAMSKRHGNNAEEGGNCIAHILKINFCNSAHHIESHNDQCRRNGKGRNA